MIRTFDRADLLRRGTTRSCRAAVLLAVVVQVASMGCTAPDTEHGALERSGGVELTSCDVVPVGAPGGTGPAEDEPVEITLWHAEGDQLSPVLTELLAEFEATRPGVVVEVEHRGNRRDLMLGMWRSSAPEDRPSLAIMPEEATRLLADSGQTVAPGRCLAEAAQDLLPVIEADWALDGVVQAVPFAVSTPVLIYNRKAFRDAGLDPDRPPATLADLRRAAERLVWTGTVPTGMVFDPGPGAAAGWVVEQWNAQADEPSVAPGDGHGKPAERAVWHEGPAVRRLAWLRKMIDDGLAASVGTNVNGLEELTALLGNPPGAAMTLRTSGSLDLLSDTLDSQPHPMFELGVAPLPGPGRGSLPGGAALWMAAGRSTAETRAAWSLAAFLASPEVQAWWAAATGYAPMSRAAAEVESLRSTWVRRPQLRVAYDALLDAGPSAGMSVGPEQEIKQLLAHALDAVVRGVDPADALRDAAADADRLLRAYQRGLDDAQPP